MNKTPARSGKNYLGFTVIELIITLGLFVVIFTIVIGIFIRAVRTSRYVSAISALNNNLSLTIEQASREIRTAYDFCVDLNCSSSIFSFRNGSGALVEYRLGSDGNDGKITRSVNGGPPAPITADDVEIIKLNFVVYTASASQQPRVTIALTARHRDSGLQAVIAPVEIQTTVSSRNPRE